MWCRSCRPPYCSTSAAAATSGRGRIRPSGAAAVAAALSDPVEGARTPDPSLLGCVGAGTGAVCGGLKGAVGTASVVLPGGIVVAALVVVNAVGSPFDPATGELYGSRFLIPGDAPALGNADPAGPGSTANGAGESAVRTHVRGRRRSCRRPRTAMRNTTIGVIATDAALTKAQCTKLAGVGHDGLARALNPVHTLFDGDTLFAVSTATAPAPDMFGFQEILTVAADVVTRALVRGLLAARGVSTPGGAWSSYAELAPSALGRQ